RAAPPRDRPRRRPALPAARHRLPVGPGRRLGRPGLRGPHLPDHRGDRPRRRAVHRRPARRRRGPAALAGLLGRPAVLARGDAAARHRAAAGPGRGVEPRRPLRRLPGPRLPRPRPGRHRHRAAARLRLRRRRELGPAVGAPAAHPGPARTALSRGAQRQRRPALLVRGPVLRWAPAAVGPSRLTSPVRKPSSLCAMGGSIEPGWYQDPNGGDGRLRWWNGQEWTQHVRSLSELRPDPGGTAAGEDDEPTSDLGSGAPGEQTIPTSGGALGPAPDEQTIPSSDAGLREKPSTRRLDPASVRRPAAPPSPEDEPSTMQIDPPQRPAPGPGEEPSTMRIDPASAHPSPPAASPFTPDEQTIPSSDAGLGDEPSTMRIDPAAAHRPAPAPDDDEPTADLGGSTMRIDPGAGYRPGADEDEPTADLGGSTMRIDPGAGRRTDEEQPTADL